MPPFGPPRHPRLARGRVRFVVRHGAPANRRADRRWTGGRAPAHQQRQGGVAAPVAGSAGALAALLRTGRRRRGTGHRAGQGSPAAHRAATAAGAGRAVAPRRVAAGADARRPDVRGDDGPEAAARDDAGGADHQPRAVDRPAARGDRAEQPPQGVGLRHRGVRLPVVRRDGRAGAVPAARRHGARQLHGPRRLLPRRAGHQPVRRRAVRHPGAGDGRTAGLPPRPAARRRGGATAHHGGDGGRGAAAARPGAGGGRDRLERRARHAGRAHLHDAAGRVRAGDPGPPPDRFGLRRRTGQRRADAAHLSHARGGRDGRIHARTAAVLTAGHPADGVVGPRLGLRAGPRGDGVFALPAGPAVRTRRAVGRVSQERLSATSAGTDRAAGGADGRLRAGDPGPHFSSPNWAGVDGVAGADVGQRLETLSDQRQPREPARERESGSGSAGAVTPDRNHRRNVQTGAGADVAAPAGARHGGGHRHRRRRDPRRLERGEVHRRGAPQRAGAGRPGDAREGALLRRRIRPFWTTYRVMRARRPQ